MARVFTMSLLIFALFPASTLGNGAFRKKREVKVRRRQFVEEVYVSLFTHVTPEDVVSLEKQIAHRFNSMPRNAAGGIRGAPLYYLAHTHFLKQEGWLVRGLDPHRLSTYNASAKIFERDDFAAYLENFIGTVANDDGFNLEYSAAFIAVFRDFVMSEGVQRLEDAYNLNGLSNEFTLSREELQPILNSFLALRLNYASSAQDLLEHKRDVQSFMNSSESNQAHMLAQDSLQTVSLKNKPRANPFSAERWSFQQAQGLVQELSHQYGDIRSLECQELKGALVDMDPAGTGRIPLGRFYSKRAVGRWTLGESVEYLRQLGVLDESVPGRAPRVIIPNYVTAVSNCESVSMYYSHCCIHECEQILGHFEIHIQKPTASPSEIVALVSSAAENAPRNLSSALVGALDQAASVHSGQIPLHGRLFAQWLHYVFPHECPYPHMSAALRPLTPAEWFDEQGKEHHASQSDVDKYVQDELDAAFSQDVAGEVHLSQWTLEEEMGWDVHSREKPSATWEAYVTAAKTFAMIGIMFTVILFVLGEELRRMCQAFFKNDRGLPFASKGAGHVL